MEITIQFIIVIVYFVLIIGLGVFAKKFVKSSRDILVAGRNLGLALTTVAIAAEWLGGTSTVAVGQWAFKYGISPIWYNISTSFGMFLFGLTWAALYHKMKVNKTNFSGLFHNCLPFAFGSSNRSYRCFV